MSIFKKQGNLLGRVVRKIADKKAGGTIPAANDPRAVQAAAKPVAGQTAGARSGVGRLQAARRGTDKRSRV